MKSLTNKEIEILLILLKDISIDYNSNNITKKIKITPAGAFKAMKNLEKNNLIIGKKMGKAIFYKINLDDYYNFRIMETLLINEARTKASRWLYEFKDLYKHTEIVIIFGSIIKNQKNANDIDILIVPKKENNINKIIKERRLISTKPIHIIKQTKKDLENNLKKKDKVILNIIKNGYILYGYEKILEAIKNVPHI